MIDLIATRIELAEHVLFRPVNDSGVMLDMETERYIGLDETALRMVQTATESPNLAETVETLSELYDADSARIEKDLLDLVADLDKRGLIRLLPVAA